MEAQAMIINKKEMMIRKQMMSHEIRSSTFYNYFSFLK